MSNIFLSSVLVIKRDNKEQISFCLILFSSFLSAVFIINDLVSPNSVTWQVSLYGLFFNFQAFFFIKQNKKRLSS